MIRARNISTNNEIDADELKLLDTVNQLNYQCIDKDCRVQLIPCSHRIKNKNRPFFRLPKGVKHTKNCAYGIYLRLHEKAGKRRLNKKELKQFPYPAVLKNSPKYDPAKDTLIEENSNAFSSEALSTRNSYNQGSILQSVTSISRIIDFYLDCPFNRDLTLKVLGWKNEYQYWFKRIKDKNTGQYKEQRIFFGALSLMPGSIKNSDNEITLGLFECEAWEEKPKSNFKSLNHPRNQKNPYTVHVSKSKISKNRISNLLRELEVNIKKQKDHYREGDQSSKKAFVFFLADPPEKNNPYRFDVIDCFIVSRYTRIERHSTDPT